MRFLFFVIFAVGAAVGLGYAWIAERLGEAAPETHRVIGAVGEEAPPLDVFLSAEDGPVRIALDLLAPASFTPDGAGALATVTVSREGQTVLAQALTFAGVEARDQGSPQLAQRVFRAPAGQIDPVEPGTYRFAVAHGDAALPGGAAVELVLERHGGAADPRLQPVGFTLMAVGFVGFVLAATRRRADGSGEDGAPARTRWGRNAQQP